MAHPSRCPRMPCYYDNEPERRVATCTECRSASLNCQEPTHLGPLSLAPRKLSRRRWLRDGSPPRGLAATSAWGLASRIHVRNARWSQWVGATLYPERERWK